MAVLDLSHVGFTFVRSLGHFLNAWFLSPLNSRTAWIGVPTPSHKLGSRARLHGPLFPFWAPSRVPLICAVIFWSRLLTKLSLVSYRVINFLQCIFLYIFSPRCILKLACQIP